MRRLAALSALLAGAVLLALVTMTCISVLGAALLKLWPAAPVGPVRGEYELIEAGTAVAVCLFLPWCQIARGHAAIDLLSPLLPLRVDGALGRLWDAVMAAALAVVCWRLAAGMLGKLHAGDTTFLLQLPVWTAYAACLPGLALAAAIAAHQALGRAG